MLKRLITIWIDYRIHHISEVITKCVLGALLIGLPVTSITAVKYSSHHKPHAAQKAVTNSPSKPKTQSLPSKKVATSKPQPPSANTTVSSTPPAVTIPKPIPVPVTQPSPGSGAKKLSPAPAAQNPSPTNTSTPSDSSSTTTTSTPTPTYATGGFTSTNWAGYVATAGNYKHISGAWTAPSAVGNGNTTTADSTWIGIGGVFSQDLIQTGTLNSISSSGQVSSFAFYELLPDSALEITSINVSPGDSMTAAIDEVSAGSWTITISDITTSQTFTTTVSYASSFSSAEWIEEDPSFASGGLVPFDSFSPAVFSNAKVDINGVQSTLSDANASPITLVDQSGTPLARPTILTADGAGFTVYRQ